MNIEIGKKALITVDEWFYGPDGRQYRAVIGTIKGIMGDQETLGIKTNARSTNWYVQVGDMIVAGCQIHYAIMVDSAELGMVTDFSESNGAVTKYEMPSRIFNADRVAL